jgi:hypothetical protein
MVVQGLLHPCGEYGHGRDAARFHSYGRKTRADYVYHIIIALSFEINCRGRLFPFIRVCSITAFETYL